MARRCLACCCFVLITAGTSFQHDKNIQKWNTATTFYPFDSKWQARAVHEHSETPVHFWYATESNGSCRINLGICNLVRDKHGTGTREKQIGKENKTLCGKMWHVLCLCWHHFGLEFTRSNQISIGIERNEANRKQLRWVVLDFNFSILFCAFCAAHFCFDSFFSCAANLLLPITTSSMLFSPPKFVCRWNWNQFTEQNEVNDAIESKQKNRKMLDSRSFSF